MKRYFLLMTAAICILLLVAPVARADLINPTLGSTVTSQPEILAFLSVLYGDPVTLISKVDADGRTGALPNELIVEPPSPFSQKTAYVSWDLTGDGYNALYVVVKDGGTVGTDPDGNKIYWIYYTVTEDQKIFSDDPQLVRTDWFNVSAGNISNIQLVGVKVPEPGILILLGIAMTAVGVASRYMRKI